MFKPIDVVTECAGSDSQTKSCYSIGDFLILEQGTRLRQVYEYWLRLPQNEFGLPDEAMCCPADGLPDATGLLGSWIDTRAEDPMDFIIREHSANKFPGYGVELSDQPLSKFPDPLHAFSCAAEYLFCKADRKPVYHEIQQITGGIRRHYTRIMLPFDGGDGIVSRVHYAVRHIMPPRRLFHPDDRMEEV